MSIFSDTLTRDLNQISIFLQEDIKQILIDDGHTASGDLVRSIKNVVTQGTNSFTIEGTMFIQGQFIISGRKKGVKGVPIDALIDWIRNKNFVEGIKKTRGIAFAIQKTIIKKGIKPDDFIEKAFNKNITRIESRLNDSIEEALDLSIENLIKNAQKVT